ncbi:MAG: hypothetical protein H6703_03725 [Myxococcales bacterium]|nr:hypothetical protein [Myxococcales bacterium]MCB9541541.1 hypothetical protein [Myxococcales bacterium]
MRRLAVLTALLLWPALSVAQQTAPRVFIIFDTSGSMLWNPTGDQDCQGDGSPGFEHRGCREGSKMFHAKAAVSAVVDEVRGVEFALLRYGQLERGEPGFDTRHVGARYRDANGVEMAINYDGSTPGCGPADLLVPPGPMSHAAILGWMDGVEMFPASKELRADGYTPLTDSIATAQAEIAAAIAQDPQAVCRPYYVLLLTDGYQQCPDGSADDPAYRAVVQRRLVEQARGLRSLGVMGQRHDVRTFVVGFGAGTRFATELDDVARAGGTAVDAAGRIDLQSGSAYQADDPAGLQAALAAAVDNARPRETCDGIDDDCDGRVDEGFARLGEPCRAGQGACDAAGRLVCAANGEGVVCDARAGDPRPEVCNGVDDDCDGQVDERVQNRCGDCGPEPAELCNGQDDDCDGRADEGALNACGGCGAVPAERCDGRDDDCDGRADEGALNACGACGPVPAEVCNCEDDDCDNRIDEGGLGCPRCDCTPAAEVCNGRDDDCDYAVDEATLNACGRCGPAPEELCNGLDDDCDGRTDERFPDQGAACGSDEGACAAGVSICRDGEVVCQGETPPSTEVCDTLDNDCDGAVDEGTHNACGYCGPTRVEVCDNVDDDCDGRTDEDVVCPDDGACINGECAPPCEIGECFGGRVCLDAHCVTPCRNTDCPSGEVCRDGACADPCAGIDCPVGAACSLGRCGPVDCRATGCPDGELCRGGECERDPCADAGCGPDQGCYAGECFDDCRRIRCPEGTLCINGGCTQDPCARVSCPFPQTCVDGACAEDPCFGVACPPGSVCRDGRCADDLCIGVTCPEGATCLRGRCSGGTAGGGLPDEVDPEIPSQEPEPTAPVDLPEDEIQSCNCDAGGDAGGGAPGPAVWLLALALAALAPRRRR